MRHDTRTTVTVDNRFAMIPHWVIFSDISDGALRLYAVLMKYADGSTKQAFPSRSTLAKDMNKSVKSVDRNLKELVALGAVHVQRRKREGSKENRSSVYTVRTVNPLVNPSNLVPNGFASSSDSVRGQEHSPVTVETPVTPPRDTSDAENYTHLSTPTSSNATDSRISEEVLAPSPNGEGRSLHAQLGISKEKANSLIDQAVDLYEADSSYYYDDDRWEFLADDLVELTGIDAYTVLQERRWDERLIELVNQSSKGVRYGASMWLAQMHNWASASPYH